MGTPGIPSTGHGCTNTSHRAITLTKNSVFYARLVDVERLIAQGYLEQLK